MPNPWLRKPLSEVFALEQSHDSHHHLHRHLSLGDLLGIGVGGTIGSGIFVLTGQIAAQHAGRATWCSFALSGLAATCSGVCFAELASRIPAAGSTYAYAHVCWGQLAAVVAAACLTLEYAVSGAAVARTWGDKVILIMSSSQGLEDGSAEWLQPWGLNLPAFFISAVATTLLLVGVRESKSVTNNITVVKMALVTFMIVGGFWLWLPGDMKSADVAWAPQGVSGIVRGATSSFFGYLGYDEVCCLAGEAKNPVRDMPRAVLGTLTLVTVTYILASIALTGMVADPSQLSPTSGFPSAFSLRHAEGAAEICAWGEVLTLPVVVLISLLAQPRLMYSMSEDGILPELFSRTNDEGNLFVGTLIAGVGMTLVAALVPFTYLDDLISAGILVAFSMTDSSLVLLRRSSPTPGHLERCLIAYNGFCLVTSLLWMHHGDSASGLLKVANGILTLATFGSAIYMTWSCPAAPQCGSGLFTTQNSSSTDATYFATPFVPLIPCLGMAVNWMLIAQLEVVGLWLLALYLGLSIAAYWFFCDTAPSWVTRYDSVDINDDVEEQSSDDIAMTAVGMDRENEHDLPRIS